jgi:DNA-directed RNA polymerase subunit RPC12/RpoP
MTAVVDQAPAGRCPACGGPWITADLDAYNRAEYRCLWCGRPPTPSPPPDLVHAEPIIRASLRKKEWRP